MTDAHLSLDGRILTIQVPIMFKTRGGRKLVISPDGVPSWAVPRARVDNTTVKAFARAFRWRKLMETDVYSTVKEIAAVENINTSYVSRVLRLTLLAPDIIQTILDGRQPADLTLAKLIRPFPIGWHQQMLWFGIDGRVVGHSPRSGVGAEDNWLAVTTAVGLA